MHSARKIEHSKIFFDDKSIKIGGKNHMLSKNNVMMPATIKNGLSYVTLHPCADQEWLKLPHIMLTSDDE